MTLMRRDNPKHLGGEATARSPQIEAEAVSAQPDSTVRVCAGARSRKNGNLYSSTTKRGWMSWRSHGRSHHMKASRCRWRDMEYLNFILIYTYRKPDSPQEATTWRSPYAIDTISSVYLMINGRLHVCTMAHLSPRMLKLLCGQSNS
jgi:hypothetical protein